MTPPDTPGTAHGTRGARRGRRRLLVGGAGGAVLLLGAGAAVWRRTTAPSAAATPEATPGPRYQARGVVRPLSQARAGSTGGGVVSRLDVREGSTVTAFQEIARVSGPNGTELVVAPWAGTITGVLVERGDTVAPGATIATVGDLSRLRVETTDVDEYLIAQVRRGQPVTVRVDALDQRTVQGFVAGAALEPRPGPTGSEHYPVSIDLVELPAALRPGMTVRVAF